MLEFFKSKLGKGKVLKTLDVTQMPKPSKVFALDIETYGSDKLPGDSPYSPKHGIAGVALSNITGDSAYFILNDNKDYQGIPIKDFIEYLNKTWLQDAACVATHNGSFDLGFLFSRGMEKKKFYTREIKVFDGWVASSVRNNGVYTSNKLKDIMREKFKIDTSTCSAKDKWMEENNTKDFGDVPTDLMGAYAADDAIYTLMEMLCLPKMDKAEFNAHDLYVSNYLHILEAQDRGIPVDSVTLSNIKEIVIKRIGEYGDKLKEQLGAAEVDITNEQEIMKYMQTKNLYCAPREVFGEVKYVFDPELLVSQSENPMSVAFYEYQKRRNFLSGFCESPEVQNRVNGNIYHPAIMQSLHARGGLPLCRVPDFTARIDLKNDVRSLFMARENHEFVMVKFCDLLFSVLAHYCKDEQLLTAARESSQAIIKLLHSRTSIEEKAIPFLIRQLIEGSGNALLEKRLKQAKVSVANDKHMKMADAMKARGIPSYTPLYRALVKKLEAEGSIKDLLGRKITIPQDKRWRSVAILLNASAGEVVSSYMDLLCRHAKSCGGYLVMTHETELLFEVNSGSSQELVTAFDKVFEQDIFGFKVPIDVRATCTWDVEEDCHKCI